MSPRTTQEYLADIELIDPDALQDVPAEALAAIVPANDENNDKSPAKHQEELLSRIIDSTEHSISPHKQIADAKLSPPASARLDVRDLLQGRADDLPKLVEALERPAMLLEGQDALLLPRESTDRETPAGGRAMPQDPVHKTVSSIIEGVKPGSADEDAELPIKTIDGCLGLKLSATKKVVEAGKGLLTALDAPQDNHTMADEVPPVFLRPATPPLLARPPRLPNVPLDDRPSEHEAIKSIFDARVDETAPIQAPSTPIVPLPQFDKWQNNQRIYLSPASPSSSAQPFPAVMSSNQPEPEDDMHIDVPLMERQPQKRRSSLTNDANMDGLVERAQKKARHSAEDLSETYPTAFLVATCIPDSLQVINTMQKEPLEGDPLNEMRVDTPVLSSPHMHPSSEEDLIQTPEEHFEVIAKMKPHNDLTLLNITLCDQSSLPMTKSSAHNVANARPNTNDMLVDIDPHQFEDTVMDESPSCAGLTPERMKAFQAAYDHQDEEEIDELMSSQSEHSEIKSFSQQTDPEIQPRMPMIPESHRSVTMKSPLQAQMCGPAQPVAIQPETTRSALPPKQPDLPARRAERIEDHRSLNIAPLPANLNDAFVPPAETLNFPLEASKPVSATKNIAVTPRAGKNSKGTPKQVVLPKTMTTPSRPVPADRKSRALALLDPQSSRSQAWAEQSHSDSSPSRTPVFRKPFQNHSQAYIEPPPHWPQSQLASFSQDSIIPSQPTPSQVTPMQSQIQFSANLPDLDSLAWERQRKQPGSSRRASLQSGSASGVDKMHEYLALRGRPELIKPKKSPTPVPAAAPSQAAQSFQVSQDVQMSTSILGPTTHHALASTSVPSLAELANSGSPEASNLPNLYCFGSERLLQNVAVHTALARLNIKINYAHRLNEDVEYFRRRLAQTRGGAFETDIEAPDLILAPRTACLFFKLSVLGLRCSICHSTTDIEPTAYNNLILDTITVLSGKFDHIYLILEAFEPPNPLTGEPAPDPRDARVNFALQSLKQSLAMKKNAPIKGERLDIKVDILLAASPVELAKIVRSKIDGQYAFDSMIADFNELPEAFVDFPISLLTAHTIIQELGSLDIFCLMSQSQRKQRYEGLIAAEKLQYIETIIKKNPQYRQPSSGFSEYSDLWRPANQQQTPYGLYDFYATQSNEKDEYDELLEDGTSPEDWLSIDV